MGGDSNSNPAPCEHARGPGDAGERAATWGGRGSGAAWAREERRRRRRGRFRRRLPSWGGRLEEGDDLTGGPHLSASRREGREGGLQGGERGTGRPKRRRPSAGGSGPTAQKRKKKEKKKKKKKGFFLGFKNIALAHF
uniref:Uncharacterized protein n=1 Tax=Oryza sativa subsp. japonica TaxID=39947 RepID=Q6EQ54_ORYSJ|nr:hypothetical protein [Oryza sativa Japonica Group]BAD29216.1 hypothetical protein [Oryza sativa Japonica Group]